MINTKWRKLRSQENRFELFILFTEIRKMENSRRCDNCDIDTHRASYAKHLRIKKQLGKVIQDDLIIQNWLFREPIGITP